MSMFPIASQTVSGTATGIVTFSNIPQDFAHLRLHVWGQLYFASGSGGTAYYLTSINGNSLARNHQMYGTGLAAFTASDGNMPIGYAYYSQTQTYPSVGVVDFIQYSNTSIAKVVKSFSGYSANTVGALGWMSDLYITNTNAITSFTLSAGGSTFGNGMRFDLYGLTTSNATGA